MLKKRNERKVNLLKSKINLVLTVIIIGLLIFSCSEKSTELSNDNPAEPSNISPADNATDISINQTLNWSCSDPESDPLTYDVYFGTVPIPGSSELVSTGQTGTTYNPGTLNYETTYYWKIIAHDDHDNSITGDVWDFTTIIGSVFEWCQVSSGDFTYGEDDEILNIDYDYEIMKYEVTNQQYVTYMQEAMNAGDITVTTATVEGYYEGDIHWSAGTYQFLDIDSGTCHIDWTGTEFTIVSGFEDHPIVKVTWFGSLAYADHYEIRLPTEHEWEKAARGNTGYKFPWGENIDGSRANYWSSGDPWDQGTTPVGIYDGQVIQGFQTTNSPSPFGAYDMAGNVWEWTDSWWSDTSSHRILRGGAHGYVIMYLYSYRRSHKDPSNLFSYTGVGFRCVRP